MVDFTLALLAALRVFFRSRGDLGLEILALRQQVAALKRKRPRPVLNSLDRLFWTTLRQLLVALERRPDYREARDRHRLASRRIPSLLALALPASRWSAEDQR